MSNLGNIDGPIKQILSMYHSGKPNQQNAKGAIRYWRCLSSSPFFVRCGAQAGYFLVLRDSVGTAFSGGFVHFPHAAPRSPARPVSFVLVVVFVFGVVVVFVGVVVVVVVVVAVLRGISSCGGT